MSDYTYEGLDVVAKERPDQGQVEIGVLVEGAYVPIAQMKLGDFHERIHDAAQTAADEAEASKSSKSSSSK